MRHRNLHSDSVLVHTGCIGTGAILVPGFSAQHYRVVHLPSVVQSEFYEATRILFIRKENKNNFFYALI